MDKIKNHAETLREILNEYKDLDLRATKGATDSIFVTDDASGVFAWFSYEWTERNRNGATHFFARLRDDKIYIEEDWTENGIANDLIERGVSAKDIVLAFQPPEMRQYTDFATA